MIEAIFWDNDGVLVDTEHLYLEATQQVLAGVGIPLTREQYVELFMVESTGAWHLAEQAGMTPTSIEELRVTRDALYCRSLEETSLLMSGVTEVLDALFGKYVMGVVTSSPREYFDLMHRGTGLLKYFDFVLTGDDYTNFKPHPEPYLRAVAKSGVSPQACLAIEDTARGARSAKQAGISCIVVPSRLTRGGTFPAADKVLDNLADILSEL